MWLVSTLNSMYCTVGYIDIAQILSLLHTIKQVLWNLSSFVQWECTPKSLFSIYCRYCATCMFCLFVMPLFCQVSTRSVNYKQIIKCYNTLLDWLTVKTNQFRCKLDKMRYCINFCHSSLKKLYCGTVVCGNWHWSIVLCIYRRLKVEAES